MEDLRSVSWQDLATRLRAELALRLKLAQSCARSAGSHLDAAAWNEAHRRVFGIACNVLRHWPGLGADDIDDIAQTVMLRLQSPELLDRLARLASGAGYLVQTLRNTAADVLRERKKRERDEAAIPLETPPSPERVAERTDTSLKLRRVLIQLRKAEQDLVEMRFAQGLSISEIAARLGIKYSAAAVRLHRVTNLLYSQMESEA